MATGVGPNLLVLSGLAWMVVRCVRLLAGRGRRSRVLVLAPHTLIALGFWLSHATDTMWILVAVGAVFALTLYALRCLREPSGAVLASVQATSVLVELGTLLVVRLVIVRDPAAPFGSGLTREALVDAGQALLLPLALVGAALVLGHRFGPAVALRTRPWRRRRSVLLVFGIAVLALFALPLVEGSQLTFLGVATPEYGTIAFLVVLALLVARVGYRHSAARTHRGGPRLRLAARVRLMRLRYRHVAYPLGLFAIVAGISALRNDFGTIVPALAATVGITWAAARQVVADPTAAVRPSVAWLGRTLRGYRATGLSILAMLAVAGFLAFGYTDYLEERARTWVDPWRYRWDAGCVMPGTGPCQESLVANVESANSQVSRALAAIADGGLWGRGLADPMSAVIPAGESDFVLAVMWNKLGGLAVLLVALLIALLAVALRQTTRTRQAVPTASGLFASGLAAMIVGQFLFVFAATLNVVPHSGIPAPFLSRGGQATLALLLGIMLLLAVAPSSVPGVAVPAATARPIWSGVAAPVGVCLLLATGITIAPYQSLHQVYAEDRPLCTPRESTRESLSSPPPDPARCSTDQIAYRRTRIELRLAGGLILQQQRPAGDWVLVGPGPLTLTDLTGLVRIGAGGPGALDTAYASVVAATTPTTLAKRVLPPSQSDVDGWVELTIDPTLQHALANALSSDVDGAAPLAGGVVAIDAGSGEILAAAAAPARSSATVSRPPVPPVTMAASTPSRASDQTRPAPATRRLPVTRARRGAGGGRALVPWLRTPTSCGTSGTTPPTRRPHRP